MNRESDGWRYRPSGPKQEHRRTTNNQGETQDRNWRGNQGNPPTHPIAALKGRQKLKGRTGHLWGTALAF